jgi:hypothetical protein
MNLIDKAILEWSYKTSKGYPDINSQEDIALFESIFGFKLNELTISPTYQSRGVFNPFYTVTPDLDSKVRDLLNAKNISFNNIIYKSVDSADEEPILKTGKTPFELFQDENDSLNVFISIPKNKVKAHYGQKTRKDSTASSNVNELLSLYFLNNSEFTSLEDIKDKEGGTGVLLGDGTEINFSQLKELIAKDETPERDIKIGVNNAKALKKDLEGKSVKNLYWTPRTKPSNINPNNPSDIIIQLDSGEFVGYSNKITTGKDVTPKFNTNVIAFFDKLGGSLSNDIKKFIDDSWDESSSRVPSSATNAKNAIKNFDISKEAFSETTSQRAFAELALEFQQDGLEFYGKDFYHIFRNNLISKISKYLTNPKNLKYFLNTIARYTYGEVVENETPCPYKLLVGSEKGSTIKDVSDNKLLRSIVTVNDLNDIKNIKTNYDGSSQSFNIEFNIETSDGIKPVMIPVTVRTRSSGGWSGKSLYITSSGVKA